MRRFRAVMLCYTVLASFAILKNQFVAQLVSCVLYLTTGGGPTLVIDQTSSSVTLGSRGWAVRPVAGRLAAFRGDRLHGVLPGIL